MLELLKLRGISPFEDNKLYLSRLTFYLACINLHWIAQPPKKAANCKNKAVAKNMV